MSPWPFAWPAGTHLPLPVCWRGFVSTLCLTTRPTKTQTTTCAEASYLPPSPEAARIPRPHARNLTAQAIGPRLRQAPPAPNSPAEPARRNLLTYIAWTHSAHGLLAVECQARDLDRSENGEPRRSCSKPRPMNIQGSLLKPARSPREVSLVPTTSKAHLWPFLPLRQLPPKHEHASAPADLGHES